MSIEPDSNVVPETVSQPEISSTTSTTAAGIASASTPPSHAVAAQPIVARYGQYYRNTRYIMTAITIVMGFWFLYDGFVRYPAENKKIDEVKAQLEAAQARGDDSDIARLSTELKSHSSHTPTDLMIQRVLAFSLPPAGLLLLLWAMYNSRGEYRLSEDVLHVPGHPPVPLASIVELNETLWDRKGIATLSYTLGTGPAGKIKLDDFVYDRVPTDRIYEVIRASMQAPVGDVPPTATTV